MTMHDPIPGVIVWPMIAVLVLLAAWAGIALLHKIITACIDLAWLVKSLCKKDEKKENA